MDLTVRVVTSLDDVPARAWDALDHGASPFLRHGFLRALADSGSIGEQSGWDPHYVLVEAPSANGAGPCLVGAVACFGKQHSYGEYIFDWGWARAASRAGVRYYPKLVIAAPVTPATGRRVLLSRDADVDRGAVVNALTGRVRELADELDGSSIHWLFCGPQEQQMLARHGYMSRASFQFHWHNDGYDDFDDFLSRMSSRRRKQIRKERRRAREGVDAIEVLEGSALGDAELDALDRFYRRTTWMHGGRDYLRPGFFHLLQRTLPEAMTFAVARRAGEIVAGALYLETRDGLYGRYWGCDEEIPFLHFELAYYVGIEHCIDRKIALFEAGAQGEHKLLRGFSPAPTYSSHWIRHAGLRDAVGRFLREEAGAISPYMRELEQFSPYKHAP